MRAPRPRRPGITSKLMLASVVLVAIPWLAKRSFDGIEAFVLEVRRNELELAAEAVAAVFHDRKDLFDIDAALPGPLAGCIPLPLSAPIQLDGKPRDWRELAERSCHFDGVAELAGDTTATEPTVSLDLTLGKRGDHLYALLRVRDDVMRFRSPRHRNLDGNDHVRIALAGQGGALRRIVVTAERAGPVTAYDVDADWRYAVAGGRPIRGIRGHWAEAPDGYTIELRLPLGLLEGEELGVVVADVDAIAGGVVARAGTPVVGTSGDLDLVALPLPGIRDILKGLDRPGWRITVIDRRRREKSVGDDEALLAPVVSGERERLIDTALGNPGGNPPAVESFLGARVTAASAPVDIGGRVMGMVLIERSNQEILADQREELERALYAIVAVCVATAGILWLFALHLVRRIQRLRDEASAAIDDDGRVRHSDVAAGRGAGDEVGDLSRTISGLLGRLAGYTGFLEQIPRTLRHEISNPLNTLSTSLQNLVSDQPDLEDSKYVQSAERGVARIGEIVEGLTDAASLEQALRDDEPECVDLAHLVLRYVENFAASCPQRRFVPQVGDEPVAVVGSGFRIEQLLDKLVDNAVAFSPRDSEIEVGLRVESGRALLSVSNAGAGVPAEIRGRVFDSMVSDPAASTSGRPHLGIGLYVVRLIVEHMEGSIAVHDRDGGGAVFVVDLPVAAR